MTCTPRSPSRPTSTLASHIFLVLHSFWWIPTTVNSKSAGDESSTGMALFFYEGVVSIRAWPLYLDREWIKNQRGWPSYILYIEAPSSLVEMFKKKYIYRKTQWWIKPGWVSMWVWCSDGWLNHLHVFAQAGMLWWSWFLDWLFDSIYDYKYMVVDRNLDTSTRVMFDLVFFLIFYRGCSVDSTFAPWSWSLCWNYSYVCNLSYGHGSRQANCPGIILNLLQKFVLVVLFWFRFYLHASL